MLGPTVPQDGLKISRAEFFSTAPKPGAKIILAGITLNRISRELSRDKTKPIILRAHGQVIKGKGTYDVLKNVGILTPGYESKYGLLTPSFDNIQDIDKYLDVFENHLELHNEKGGDGFGKLDSTFIKQGVRLRYSKAYGILMTKIPNATTGQIEAARLMLSEVFGVKFDSSGKPEGRLQNPTEFNVSNLQIAKYAEHQLNIVDQAIVLSPDPNIKEQLYKARTSYANLGSEYRMADKMLQKYNKPAAFQNATAIS